MDIRVKLLGLEPGVYSVKNAPSSPQLDLALKKSGDARSRQPKCERFGKRLQEQGNAEAQSRLDVTLNDVRRKPDPLPDREWNSGGPGMHQAPNAVSPNEVFGNVE